MLQCVKKLNRLFFIISPPTTDSFTLKQREKDAPRAIAAMEKQWKKYNAGFPFTYAFLDETFNNLYKAEEQTGLLYNIFAAIAIFISCLGLLGLAAYTAQVRTREIGVRKVLGASVPGIIALLAKDFLKLVFIAIALAIPLAWYAMNNWLQDFAYKISIGWQVFILSGSIAIVIAIVTISFQSIKASLVNPVRSFERSEVMAKASRQ